MKFFDDFSVCSPSRGAWVSFYGAITKGDGTAGGKYVIASGRLMLRSYPEYGGTGLTEQLVPGVYMEHQYPPALRALSQLAVVL